MNLLGTSLIITAVGMGLVFIAILVLWALMEIIVKINAGKDAGAEKAGQPSESGAAERTGTSGGDLRARAAAVAVAVALSLRKRTISLQAGEAGSEAAGIPSLWQAAGRMARVNRSSRARRR